MSKENETLKLGESSALNIADVSSSAIVPNEQVGSIIPAVSKSFYCQSEIEMGDKCNEQCQHCKEYYKPLEQ